MFSLFNLSKAGLCDFTNVKIPTKVLKWQDCQTIEDEYGITNHFLNFVCSPSQLYIFESYCCAEKLAPSMNCGTPLYVGFSALLVFIVFHQTSNAKDIDHYREKPERKRTGSSTIRLMDPNIQKENFSSIPYYSLALRFQ